jgi:hypothetical protein
MEVHSHNLHTQEAEEEACKFKYSVGYTVRPYLKNRKKKELMDKHLRPKLTLQYNM